MATWKKDMTSSGIQEDLSAEMQYNCEVPQSFPALGSFQMSQLFMSGGQNIGVSASTSVLPLNTQD